MEIKIYQNSARLADAVSDDMINMLAGKPDALIVMASGHSPKMTCEFFCNKIKGEGLSASTFHFAGLDEWVGIPPQTTGSCHHDFQERLFGPLQMKSSNYHLFDGISDKLEEECQKMDDYICDRGGIDLMIVGLGMNGHIGFNEPGCDFNAKSHVAKLEESTTLVGQKYFQSPTKLDRGITIGFSHLRTAKKVILIASGQAKSAIVKEAFLGTISNLVPASIMQELPQGVVMLDQEAAGGLS